MNPNIRCQEDNKGNSNVPCLWSRKKYTRKGVMETTRGEAAKKAQMLGDLDFHPGSGREEQWWFPNASGSPRSGPVKRPKRETTFLRAQHLGTSSWCFSIPFTFLFFSPLSLFQQIKVKVFFKIENVFIQPRTHCYIRIYSNPSQIQYIH